MVKKLLRALAVIILVSCFTLLLDDFGWLKSFETAALDRFFLLKENVLPEHVVVVAIDDDDYNQLFHERSPLDPPTLADLISAISRNKPRLIAVDIDTSAKIFQDMKPSPDWGPVIWARGAHESLGTDDGGSNDDDTLILEGVWGRAEPPSDLLTGVAIMPLDSDSRIRRFQRQFIVNGAVGSASHQRNVDSFHWAIVKKYCELAQSADACKNATLPNPSDEHGDLILNLAIEPYAFTPIKSSQVLSEWTAGAASGNPPAFISITDKIVVLGGTYQASGDYHYTPTGPKFGVDFTAIAVESELSGTGLRKVAHKFLLALEVLAGLILVILNFLFPSGLKRFVALASIPLLALIGSLIAFSSLALWANFIPTLAATQLHGLYDKLAERKQLRREVTELRRRLDACEQVAQKRKPDPSIDSAADLGQKVDETESEQKESVVPQST